MPDLRRRIPASTIKSLLRRLESLYVLSKRGKIDRATAKIIQQTAESAYRDLYHSVPWLDRNQAKKSDEIRSAARAAGLVTQHKGQDLSADVLGYRLKCLARYRSGEVAIPGYWFESGGINA